MLNVCQQWAIGGAYSTDNIHPALIRSPEHRSALQSPAQPRSAEQTHTLRCESKIPRHIQRLMVQTNNVGLVGCTDPLFPQPNLPSLTPTLYRTPKIDMLAE